MPETNKNYHSPVLTTAYSAVTIVLLNQTQTTKVQIGMLRILSSTLVPALLRQSAWGSIIPQMNQCPEKIPNDSSVSLVEQYLGKLENLMILPADM